MATLYGLNFRRAFQKFIYENKMIPETPDIIMRRFLTFRMHLSLSKFFRKAESPLTRSFNAIPPKIDQGADAIASAP
jgi:hypothetical protein